MAMTIVKLRFWHNHAIKNHNDLNEAPNGG
jgi:hypothetical protein